MIKGRARVQCLSGNVQIMGYNLGSDHAAVEVYSPVTNSFCTLTTIQCEHDIEKNLQSVSKTDQDKTKLVESVMKKRKSCVIVKINSFMSSMCDLLTDYSPFHNLFETSQDGPVNEMLQTVGVSVHGVEDKNLPVLKIRDNIQCLIAQWISSISESNCGKLVR